MGRGSDSLLQAARDAVHRSLSPDEPSKLGQRCVQLGEFIAAAAPAISLPFACRTIGSISFAYIGRPKLSSTDAEPPADLFEAELASRFQEHGAALIDRLTGSFALAIFDGERNVGIVATDRMGTCPLFVLETTDGVAFADTPMAVCRIVGRIANISLQAIYDYLYCHVVPAPRSIYDGPRRLLPGECIQLERGAVQARRYWQPRFDETRAMDVESGRHAFLEALRASVRDAMQGAACGAFLSGGTDSSTIAGLMTEIGGKPAPTFSIGFEAAGFDEMEYARLASSHFGTEHHEYYVTPSDIVDTLPRLAQSHPQPFGNSSALPAYFCARLAREHGIERMLGGDGGDELFGGNARYAKQQLLSFYEHIPSKVRTLLLEPLSKRLNRQGRLPVLGKLASYVEQASVPMPERLETYNFLARHPLSEVLSDELTHHINSDEPARFNREAYFNSTASSLINRMLALDFKTTLADNDLPKVVGSCQLAGLPVAFPMLDSRVVDFSLSLPPRMKLRGTRLRYFFKEALRGFLPDAIIEKQKHGFGLPFGEWVVRDRGLRELAYDTLQDVKQRHWVRTDFVDALRDRLLPTYPNYYGTMAWLLIALEMWMKANHDRLLTAD